MSTVWLLDGNAYDILPNGTDPKRQWLQDATWAATYRAETTPAVCGWVDENSVPHMDSVYTTTNGTGRGTGKATIRLGVGNLEDYDVFATLKETNDLNFTVTTAVFTQCPGFEGSTSTFSACRGVTTHDNAWSTNPDGLAATRLQGVWQGDDTGSDCSSLFQDVTVRWNLVRGAIDKDVDGIEDAIDNCPPSAMPAGTTRPYGDPPVPVPATWNPEQTDANGNGVGDVCEPSQQGTIIVEKQTVPDGAPDTFGFSGALTGSIADGGTLQRKVDAGTYVVNEQFAAGWQGSTVLCSDANSFGSVGTSGSSATFVVEEGETVRCVFTNIRQTRLRIDKVTVPSGDSTSFSFVTFLPGGERVQSTLRDDSEPLAFTGPGQYQISELPLPSGWALGSITCDGGAPSINGLTATVTLQTGDDVLCTFTNTRNDLVLTGLMTYNGVVATSGATATGADIARVTGSGAALVAEICMTSMWSATNEIGSGASMTMLWNGEIAEGSAIARLQRSPFPHNTKKGLRPNYTETVWWNSCRPGTSVNFPAFPGPTLDPLATSPVLTIFQAGLYVKLKHTVLFTVRLTNGVVLGPLEVDESSKTGIFSWSEQEEARYTIP